MKENKPLVSICCLTYNHNEFIKDAIEGFLMQKTLFSFEIIIHDDASTDDTPAIIRSYTTKYPNLFHIIYQTENQYSKILEHVFTQFVLPIAKGKYIALCEGDDYWTDPFKLQKQVDFLDAHENVIMTFGNARIKDMTGNYYKKDLYMHSYKPKFHTPEEIITLGLPTLTMVFRNVLKSPPEWYSKVISGDYFLRYLLSKHGIFYYHGEVFGVHRKHFSGVSRTTDKLEWNLNTIKYLKIFHKDCLESQKSFIIKKIDQHYIYVLFLSYINRRFGLMFTTFFKVVFSKGFYSRTTNGLARKLIKEVVVKKNIGALDIF